MTTGPLGQGISTAVGMALAERMLARALHRRPQSSTTSPTSSPPTATSRRASRSEAGSIAGHLGLGKLISFYDDNHISIEGDTALSFSEDVPARFEAYGWHVQNLGEDIGLDRIEEALDDRAGRDRQAVADRRAHAHRPRLAEQAGHARGARLAARRGGDPAHQGGLRLAEPGAVLHPRRGARALPRVASTAATSSHGRVAAALRGPTATTRRGRALDRCSRTAARRLGRRRAAQGPGRGHDRHPQGLQRGHPVGGRRTCPSSSAAPPTSRRRR